MADFRMPALGADMETGKVVQWRVAPGSRVKRGDIVAVVETHKGAIDVEIFLEGEIDDLVPLGSELPIGAVLAHVRTEGAPAGPPRSPEDLVQPATAASAAQPPTLRALPTSPALPTSAALLGPPTSPASPTLPTRSTGVSPPGRTKVSPAARRRAQERGIDPDRLHGSGIDGSVTLADVERAVARPQPAPPAVAMPREHMRGFDPAQMRQAIAAAMSRSKREIPHYYLASTLDFGAAGAWLQAYNGSRAPDERLLPAVLLLKATARALAERPQLNGFYIDGAFRPGAGIHVGWAIALRGGGLVAPAIHDADRQSLPELMGALRDLVQRARAGGLRSSELTDPTVTVTSLGDRGADSVLGVIYPPQVAMVGFGRVLERPWVVDGVVTPRAVVAASLAGEHRASDGHLGGLLLEAIDRALQSPETLLARSSAS
jgi:pyruvate dehydrogenase E2 component (dihydrolipoamide acetyltransferase)